MPVKEQAVALYTAVNGYLFIAVEDVVRFGGSFGVLRRSGLGSSRLKQEKKFSPELEEELKKAIVEFKKEFVG